MMPVSPKCQWFVICRQLTRLQTRRGQRSPARSRQPRRAHCIPGGVLRYPSIHASTTESFHSGLPESAARRTRLHDPAPGDPGYLSGVADCSLLSITGSGITLLFYGISLCLLSPIFNNGHFVHDSCNSMVPTADQHQHLSTKGQIGQYRSPNCGTQACAGKRTLPGFRIDSSGCV